MNNQAEPPDWPPKASAIDEPDGTFRIGPFKNFTHDPEFQDELTQLCRKYNLKHGHLSQKRYDELTAAHA